MARPRRITATPLLVAGTGALITLGCGGPGELFPPGNLMAPPQATVCVDVMPDDAEATVMVGSVITTDRCTAISSQWLETVTVSAPGYETASETVEFTHDETATVIITLTPTP